MPIRCHIAQGFRQGLEGDAGIGILTAEECRQAFTASGVRHAAAYGLQVALCTLAAKAALEDRVLHSERLGIITNGGPWATEAALSFLRSAFSRGPQFVNPLVFPATLVSAGPTSTAAVVGAQAFAIAAGYDELAFFDVLHRGQQSLIHGVAEYIVAIASCGQSDALQTSLNIAGRGKPLLDCSIAFLLTQSNSRCLRAGDGEVELVDAVADCEGTPWPTITRRFEAVVNADGTITYPIDSPLSGGLALSAAGAALCQAAIRAESRKGFDPTGFVVSCRKGTHIGAAFFRFCA